MPSAAIVTAAILGCAAAYLAAQAPAVDVPVSVVVLDSKNRPITGLSAVDFEAYIDSRSVPVTSVAPRGPLSLAVVVDTSRSTAWGRSGSIPPPLEEVLAALTSLRDDDRIRVGSFGPKVRFGKPWRPRAGRNLRGELEQAFKADADETHGPSPIWDVVYETVAMLSVEAAPRAILLLTDGRSTGNSRSLDLAAAYAGAHGVAIHSIVRYFEAQLPQGDDKAVIIRPWVALERLATFTGGTAMGFRMHEGLHGMMLAEQLGWAMRDTYVLRLAPPPDGTVHQLDIRLKRPGVKIHAPVSILSPQPR